MKQKILSFLGAMAMGFLPHAAAVANIAYDTSDPMFLNKMGGFLSNSNLSFMDDALRVSQKFSYGFTDKFTLGADIKYQQDFNGSEDGFSNIGFSAEYRLSDGASQVMTDALFGIAFGGNKRVREPDFADTIYHAGVRAGRQWERFTLAGAVKTSWIFDEIRGMAYIDLIPEAYVRLTDRWKTGLGLDWRRATNPNFDREWANFKLACQYDRTQYVGHVDYEFKSGDWLFGFKLNILF